MSELVFPNFLIAGAAKSGTTSLYHWLSQHPDVFMPENKEPSYFVDTYGFSDWNRYLRLFEHARGKKAVGEASTPYMSAPESPAWIHRILPDVKIIILLRNPIARAWSLYSWMVMEGYEWLSTFERAVTEEDRRFADVTFRHSNPQYFWNYMYFRSGLYHDQVREYLRLFGPDRVRIYLFEDLVTCPRAVYVDACKFLDLDPAFEPALTVQNVSKIPRSIGLQFRLRRLLRGVYSRRGPGAALRRSTIAAVMAANVRRGRRYEMPAVIRGSLAARYRDDVQRLGASIDRPCIHWVS